MTEQPEFRDPARRPLREVAILNEAERRAAISAINLMPDEQRPVADDASVGYFVATFVLAALRARAASIISLTGWDPIVTATSKIVAGLERGEAGR
jgi:hypothetical protein